ncbi:hypothetical protein Taro_012889 [Colocasia esculenta]|uniref:NB-ARC domain-containing protein n=1 Tax=Colocasia esculenta TaxID=4460 RepID=A0A843UH14_COLES|nr:hypothetical protein [Colocasia esculenta]
MPLQSICPCAASCLLPSVQESLQEAVRNYSRGAISSLNNWICSLCNVQRIRNDLRREVDELKAHKNDVLNNVALLEISANMRRTYIISLWLDWVDELDAAVSEFENSSCCESLQRCCGGLCLSCELDNMLRQVKELKEQKDKLGNLVCRLPPPPVLVLPVISDYTNSNSSLVDEILNYLKEVDMVGIYGLGGIGKTELLKAVNNHLYRMSSDAHDEFPFWMVIYAHLTQDDTLSTVQVKIRERLDLSESEELPEVLSSVTERCMLLLLDNVWEALDWDVMGIPGPGPTMKVIFTTASKMLCDDMKVRSVSVRFLNDNESWLLFCQTMGEAVGPRSWDECSDYIKDLAKRVVISQCGGLPRAIIAIAWAVGMNYDGPQRWMMIEKMLKVSPHQLAGMIDVLSPLKCSLDKLEKDMLSATQCLLYCSLFSESRNINTEQLIDFWIGEGFLDTYGHDLPFHSLHQKGTRVIEVLQKIVF